MPTPVKVAEQVAVPLDTGAALHNVVDPSAKVTVPVGAPEPGACTVTEAVKVTLWPATEAAIPAGSPLG